MLKLLHRIGVGEEDEVLVQAANVLDVGEFQVFQLAYEAWHGQEADPALLDRLFFSYLYGGPLPPWARHYARQIAALSGQGGLHAHDPAYHRFDHSYQSNRPLMREGWRPLVLVLSAIIIFYVLIFYGAHAAMPDWVSCQFSPCYWDDSLKPSAPPSP